ncbi:hypothetical protein CK203_114066 [Vitis vinifera]|uniref:Fiber protein Fb34 n=1 Tax=Vitis vinifera TaxID=29760 RepID=A0A438ECL9_VITVI|nr:hypothetical protein CK203_114066 [Vitis vinifera]
MPGPSYHLLLGLSVEDSTAPASSDLVQTFGSVCGSASFGIRARFGLTHSVLTDGTIVTDDRNATYCVYNSDVATGYGVGGFLFLLTRMTFLVAEACLIAGATKNAYHTKYRGMIYAQNFSCETLRKGVFIAGAVFVVATMILNVYYYMYFSKATDTQAVRKANRASSTVGMTGYA